jgi:hypothetical protein
MGSDSKDGNNDWFGPTSEIVDKVLPDVLVRSEGSIFLFCPLTPAAKQWIAENVKPNAQWFGQALVVEHHYALELAVGMRDAGLALA